MGLKKQKFRKHADPGLKFNPGHGLLHAEPVDYIIRAAVKNIAGRRVLAAYLYDRQTAASGEITPRYTIFQTRDDYATLDCATQKWRSASFDNLVSGWPPEQCAFYTKKDEQRVIRFCGLSDQTGFHALKALQRNIMDARLKKRVMARERIIIKRMKPLPPLPRDLAGWLHRDVLPAYIFYRYHKGKKPMAGYCTACRHEVSVSGAKHSKSGVCPRCGRKITFKAEGRSTNIWDRATAQVIQKIGERELVLRIIKAERGYRNFRQPTECIRENARFFIYWNDGGEVTTEEYYYSYFSGILTQWKKGIRPQFSHWNENYEGAVCGNLYFRNLDETLKDTPWRYSQLKEFYLKDGWPLEVLPYLRAYLQHPMIEYLVKLGLCRLAASVVYEHRTAKAINADGKNLREILGVGPEDLPILQRVNADTDQLELYQALKNQGVRADERLLRWYAEHGTRSKEDILYPLRYVRPHKLMDYIGRQHEQLKNMKTASGSRRYESLGQILVEYKDYLRMGRGLDYDLTDSFVLFPRNLHLAHDQAAGLFNTDKAAIYNKLIETAYPILLEQYGFTKNGFTMIPPQSADAIVREGHVLHHCVGGYAERVANEECIILFLRRTENVNEPFCTVELRDGIVTQARGKQNGALPPEVRKYIDLWERRKLTAITKVAA